MAGNAMDDSDNCSPSGDEQSQKENLKRAKFFGAARPLFLRYGFRKTTVEDICHRAGASKRTFYELFRDKLDLLMQLCLHLAEIIAVRWKERLTGNENAGHQLEVFLEEYVRISREQEIFKIMITEPSVFTKGMSDTSRAQLKPLVELLQGILERGMKTGEFRRMNTGYVTWIVFTLLDSVHFILPEFSGVTGPLEDEAFAVEVREFLIRSVLSPKV
jgi:AcrR family transcriptional regulator